MQAPEEAEWLYRRGHKAPYWRAPELLTGEAPSKATDVYAYGMLLYEVLYRREPFENENREVCSLSRQCIPSPLLSLELPSTLQHGAWIIADQ